MGGGKAASARLLIGHGAVAGSATVVWGIPSAWAETPRDTLLVLVENGPNSLDIHGIRTTFRSYVACWNLYDRLLTFARKTLPGGGLSYDYTKIEPDPSWPRISTSRRKACRSLSSCAAAPPSTIPPR